MDPSHEVDKYHYLGDISGVLDPGFRLIFFFPPQVLICQGKLFTKCSNVVI